MRFALAIVLSLLPIVALSAEPQTVREQRTVVVQGFRETWQLVWDGQPGSICGPEEIYMSASTPCYGFAYGEYGALWLVRKRGEREIERMDLRPLFTDYAPLREAKGTAYLQRWPSKEADLQRGMRGDPRLAADIKRRICDNSALPFLSAPSDVRPVVAINDKRNHGFGNSELRC